jgi:membrane-associated protease RseP (regulator of RpoE activity)
MAGNGTITTSLVINFTDPNDQGGGVLQAEIDSRPDGWNGGNTSFIIGDSPAFLVYKTSNVSTTMIQTDGSISAIGSAVITISEYITFAKSNTSNLAKPPNGSVSFSLIGGTGGPLTVIGTTVSTPSPIFAVYKAVYTTTALGYRLVGASDPVVLIVIEGIVTGPGL